MRQLFLFTVFSLFIALQSIDAQINESEKSSVEISPHVNSIKKLPYRIFLPKNDTDSETGTMNSPRRMLVFLHGSGERGADNTAQLKHGKAFFERMAQDHNTAVLVPQCPENLSWHNGYSQTTAWGRDYHYPKKAAPNKVLDVLERLIDSVAEVQKIDASQISVGGLSMGGMGTLELLRRRPEFYKRAFVICGGAHGAVARQIGRTPVWFFHGEEDKIVSPKYAKRLYRKLKRKGIQTKLTLYPGVNHNSWDLAFEDQQLIPWLVQ